MAGKRHDDGRVCLCDRPDGTCAGLVVRRLSRERVRDLAEEIWTASSGYLPQARPVPDPRSSRAGASTQAAYRSHRERQRASWRLGWMWWASAVLAAFTAGALLIGLTIDPWLGVWMGLLLAACVGWRLRFRPSPGVGLWRRQAALQRRTAAVLLPLGAEGHLVLHDVALPGWLDSLEHLVIGRTGVWVVASWRQRRLRPAGAPPAATADGLRGASDAVAEVLGGWAEVPVRPLLCVYGRWWPRRQRVQGGMTATPPNLVATVRSGPGTAPGELDQATARLLQVLRPAAS